MPSPVLAKANPKYASIVMDADTGQILSESGGDKTVYPASLTKMMTLYLTFEALQNGTLHLNDRVYVSRHAAGMSPSKLNVPAGSSVRVEDAVLALVTKSANDIAAALGEKLGGTESRFALMMTRKAHDVGMRHTRFMNASGLHNSQQVTTARDMAILARALIRDYPGYYHYFSTRQFSYKGATFQNHNRLMASYKGMDGIKTGYIVPSGFNLVASAKRDGHRLIGVVFGGRSATSRNTHMATLLDRGFARVGARDATVMAAAKPALDVPVPVRKPALTAQIAALNSLAAASGADTIRPGDTIIGEGDYDPAGSRRIETGLLAIAAVQGQGTSDSDNQGIRTVSYDAGQAVQNSWAVQIGAFSSRDKADKALRQAVKALPQELAGDTAIVPLKSGESWLFRGRLGGYTREEAAAACNYIPDCLPVSPQAY